MNRDLLSPQCNIAYGHRFNDSCHRITRMAGMLLPIKLNLSSSPSFSAVQMKSSFIFIRWSSSFIRPIIDCFSLPNPINFALLKLVDACSLLNKSFTKSFAKSFAKSLEFAALLSALLSFYLPSALDTDRTGFVNLIIKA